MVLWESVNGVFTASASWVSIPEWLDKFEWFPFVMTTVGALGAVFLGAYLAQRLAERARLKTEQQKELQEVNRCIVVTYSTISLAYALKKQHIKKLKTSYDADCLRLEAYKRNKILGIAQAEFKLAPNFHSFHLISPPVQALQDIVLAKLSMTGRGLAAMSSLSDAVGNLNNAMASRNEILVRLKDRNLPPGAEMHHIYFGTPYGDGEANNEYGDLVGAMALYVDDVMFFGIKLCEDLVSHGKRLAEAHLKEFGGKLHGVTEPILDKAEKEGMIPKDEVYKDWLAGFQNRPNPKKPSRWQRVKRIFRSRSGKW